MNRIELRRWKEALWCAQGLHTSRRNWLPQKLPNERGGHYRNWLVNIVNRNSFAQRLIARARQWLIWWNRCSSRFNWRMRPRNENIEPPINQRKLRKWAYRFRKCAMEMAMKNSLAESRITETNHALLPIGMGLWRSERSRRDALIDCTWILRWLCALEKEEKKRRRQMKKVHRNGVRV